MPASIVTNEQVEKALRFLAHSDIECAELKAEVSRTEFIAKLREAKGFLTASGNIEERKCTAKVTAEVGEAWEEHFKVIAKYESLKARRERASITVDIWRSLQANRRMGQLQ